MSFGGEFVRPVADCAHEPKMNAFWIPSIGRRASVMSGWGPKPTSISSRSGRVYGLSSSIQISLVRPIRSLRTIPAVSRRSTSLWTVETLTPILLARALIEDPSMDPTMRRVRISACVSVRRIGSSGGAGLCISRNISCVICKVKLADGGALWRLLHWGVVGWGCCP